jgi:hypothetical protein
MHALEQLGYRPVKVQTRRGSQRSPERLYGVMDLLGLQAHRPLIGVRLCAASWTAGEEAAALGRQAAARDWLTAGNDLEVWCWQKRACRWRLLRHPVSASESVIRRLLLPTCRAGVRIPTEAGDGRPREDGP